MGLGRKNINSVPNTDIKEVPAIKEGSGVSVSELKEHRDWLEKNVNAEPYGVYYRAKAFVRAVFFSQLSIILMRSGDDLRENLEKFIKGEYEFGECPRGTNSVSPY